MSTLSRTLETEVPPYKKLMDMIQSIWIPQAIYVAAELGLADLLESGAKHYSELAQETNANEEALYRLLRALSRIGVFQEVEPGWFAQSDISAYLQKEVALSQHASALTVGQPYKWDTFGSMLYSVKTGRPAFDHIFEKPFFEYLSDYPEMKRAFHEGMATMSNVTIDSVCNAYDFSKFETIMDVGAGHGALLTAILNRFPTVNGIFFDRQELIDSALPHLHDSGVFDRCTIETGNFFEELPNGADALILKYIIHDWSDEQALTILHNCHRALPPDGVLLLVEQVVPTESVPSDAEFLDMVMLTMFGGRERTEQEYSTLLERAGFQLRRVIPPTADGGTLSLLECVPVYNQEATL